MRRVVVIGASGSGKTTFARVLALQLGLPHVEADSMYWGPNWTPREDFGAQLQAVLAGDEWVIDGNYSNFREIIWPRADTLIWLDFSLPTILCRLVPRTARRCLTRQTLWGGNTERAMVQLFTRESIVRWSIGQFFRYRRDYPPLLMEAARRGKYIVRFRSSRQARQWLADLHAAQQIIASNQIETNPSG